MATPNTLADASKIPHGRVTVRCQRCSRQRTYEPAQLLEKHGAVSLAAIAHSDCEPENGGCGGKRADVNFWIDVWARQAGGPSNAD